MPTPQTAALFRHLRQWAAGRWDDPHSDRELLQRFATQRDEAAFAALVRRHGPMVLSVCRRILHQTQDAEDAFQATFLVLFRKAGAYTWRDSIGGWLHRVAARIALRLRAGRTGISPVNPAAEGIAADPLEQLTARELLTAFDEELARLPERYREPLVLCHLEGKTQEEAARRLGRSLSTIRRRLERGRKVLHQRLTRRGLELPATLGTVLLAKEASAVVPVTLRIALTQALNGSVSARVAVLAEGALQVMSMAKLKTGVALILMLGTFVAGASGTAHWKLAEKPAEPKPAGQSSNAETIVRERKDSYGDLLPEGARLRMGTIQLRHDDALVTFSRDGRTLISCGRRDGLTRHWNLATGRLIREIPLCKTAREKRQLVSVSLSGRCAALKMKDAVLFRDVETGEERGRLPLKTEEADYLTPSADAKFLVVKKDGGPNASIAELWDVLRAKKIRSEKYENGVSRVAFSRDSKCLALKTGHQDLRLWDTATGKESHLNGVGGWAMCFSPDGKTLAISPPGGPIRLLDPATLQEQGQLTRPESHTQPLIDFEYSTDGKLLAGISREGIVVWDVAAGTVKQCLPASHANALAFAPDGKTLAYWGWELGSLIRLWDIATDKPLHARPGHPHHVDVLAVSPDGKVIASGALHDPELLLWDAATGRLRARLKGVDEWMEACAFSADGKQLVSSGWRGMLQLWDVGRAKEVRRLEVPGKPARNFAPSSVQSYLRPSPDGKRLSAVLIDYESSSRAIVWDLATGKTLSQRPYKVDIHRRDQPGGGYGLWVEAHVALAPDGQSVTVRKEKRLAIEDVKSGRILALLPEKIGRPVRFSPDGQLVAAAALKPKDDPYESPDMEGLRLIETATGQEVVSIDKGQGYLPAFSHDGRLLANIDKEGIHIWDVATGKEFFRRPWPADVDTNPFRWPATSLAFLPDGRGVVTGMDDGTLLVWDVPAHPAPRPPKQATPETLWKALLGEARQAHRAVYALAATPAATVSFLTHHLQPAAAIDGKRLTQLLADLDSADFETRESAAKELIQLRDDIEPELRRFLESKPSLEARRRIETILDSPRLVPDASKMRTLRALRVLEMIATPEARQLLRKLAGGASGARETRKAAAALARLQRRSSPSP